MSYKFKKRSKTIGSMPKMDSTRIARFS